MVETIKTLLRLGKDTDVYADNEGFWLRQLPTLARLLDHARDGEGSLRNARGPRLRFRSVGGRGEVYPAWVQDLRGRSGAYVIRVPDESGTPTIVYVGSSQSDRLHETLTRHFQRVRHEAQEVPMT